jgi:3-hydroxyacyl-CoA dehydrogenase
LVASAGDPVSDPPPPLLQAALDKGMKGIEESLKKLHGKRLAAEPDAAAKTDAAVKAAMGRITTSTDVSALKDCSTSIDCLLIRTRARVPACSLAHPETDDAYRR